jgi:hypothetical protein
MCAAQPGKTNIALFYMPFPISVADWPVIQKCPHPCRAALLPRKTMPIAPEKRITEIQ